MTLESVGAEAATLLAALRTAADVYPPWTAQDFQALMSLPHARALIARDGDEPLGYALYVVHMDESELYDIAIATPHRRRGLGRELLQAAIREAISGGARVMHLEVAIDNEPAVRLYAGAGFEPVGRRRGYYLRENGERIDALCMTARFAGVSP